MGSFFCEVWGNANYSLDLSLMRRTFSADPISPCQPQAAYYAMRNLSTALDGLHQDSFPVDVDGAADVEVCTMSRPGERVVALWTTGLATDECSGTPFRLDVEGHFSSVTGFDCMNGVEQEVAASRSGAKTIIDGILVRDYPILLRLASGSAS